MGSMLKSNSRKRSIDRNIFGGKGAGLYRLAKLSRKHGFKVPDFFIIPVDYEGPEGDITLRARYIEGEGNFAVRSSSPFEDGGQHSFAGVFKTHLDVSRSDLVDAVRDVQASALSEKALEYAYEEGRKIDIDNKMAVIVQRMADSDYGGVIYSTLPSYPLAASVEFAKGSPSHVVEGTGRVEIHDFDKQTLEELFESEDSASSYGKVSSHYFEKPWNGRGMGDAVGISQNLEREFGFPLDIEFAWTYRRKRGALYFLQARAITEPLTNLQKVNIPKVPKNLQILNSNVVRGVGEYEGPAVFFPEIVGGGRFMGSSFYEFIAETLAHIDAGYPNGYALIVPHFSGTLSDFDRATPNKKAIIEYGFRSRSSHAMTVARERGILYIGDGFYLDREDHEREEERIGSIIKTGDRVKVVCNGRKGLVYKITNPES